MALVLGAGQAAFAAEPPSPVGGTTEEQTRDAMAASRADDPMYEPAEPARAAPELAEDTVPRLEGAVLEEALPDLENRSWPPPWSVTFTAGSRYPLQMTGFGIGAEGYLGRAVRIELVYSAGLALQGAETHFSNYGKAIAGLKLFGGFGRLPIDASAPRKTDASGRLLPPAPPLLKAWLPTYHAVLVEAGVVTGVIPLGRCRVSCPPSAADDVDTEFDWERPQLVYPLGGLRYVVSLGARSKRMPAIDRAFVFQVFAHAIYKPFFDSLHDVYWPGSEEHVERYFVGGQGGFVLPFCLVSCIKLAVTAGYLPAPAGPLVEVGFLHSLEPGD